MTGRFLSGTLPALLAFALLLAGVLGAWRMLDQAPARERVAEIRITPGDEPLILGHAELGQRAGSGRAAAADHLRVRHGADGWWIANVSDRRRVDAPTDVHRTRYLRRWPLAAGDRIRLGATEVRVREVDGDAGRLVLAGPGGEARWRDGSLETAQAPFEKCPPEGAAWWGRSLRSGQELRLFGLGGEVPCPRRWPLTGVPTGGVEVLWLDGRFLLAPGTADARMSRAEGGDWSGFADLELRLDDPAPANRGLRLVLGRTHYRPTWDGGTLILTPRGGTDLWPADDLARPGPRDPRVAIRWASASAGQASPWAWLTDHPGWSLSALALGLLGVLAASARPGIVQRTPRAAVLGASLLFGTLTLATAWSAPVPPAWLLVSCGLAWGGASLLLFAAGRLGGPAGWLWAAAVGLAGWGLVVQGQLGLGGDNTRWLELAEGHWRAIALVGWLIWPLAPMPRATLERFSVALADPDGGRVAGLLAWAVLGLALAGLAAQVLTGREEGVWGIQPVEGVKTLSALLLAHAGLRLWARRNGLSALHGLSPVRSALELTGLALLFVLFAAALLWAVRDMSPALLLVFLTLPLLWRLAPHPLGVPSRHALLVQATLAGLVLLGGGLLLWIQASPDALPRWAPQYHRLMAWAEPARFAESAFQVTQALELGSPGAGPAHPGPFGWNGAVMGLPVVQNDFIGTFVLNRFGVPGGWSVLALQVLLVLALFASARRAAAWGGAGGLPLDFSLRAVGVLLSLAVHACAWLFLAHGLIAWGNVLGLLPVMGQPMTFLAAGNSHLFFFALPVLVLGLVTGWVSGPSPEDRSA